MVPQTASGVVVEEESALPVLQDVTREQSTETMAVVEARKVTTLVVGQTKLKVIETESVHVVLTAIGGVAKTMDVLAGQEMVIAPVVAGNVKVVTVALGAVTGTPIGV